MQKNKLDAIFICESQHKKEIWFYTFREWSAQQADKYQDELFSAFLKIANPKTVRISVNHIRQEYFKHKINRHIIFYRMETDQVIVVRILHEMMDLSGNLQ